MDKEIIENNKLIAKFMNDYLYIDKKGMFIYDKDRFTDYEYLKKSFYPEEMCYLTMWDWLMPVVKKIESLFDNRVNVKIHSGEYSIYLYNKKAYENRDYNKYDFYYSDWERNKLQGVYKAIIEFIKWYNKENK